MKTRGKIVARSGGAFGGSTFRAVDRGELITIEESVKGARWRAVAVATVAQFYTLADRFRLFDPYRKDAGTMWRMAGVLVRGERAECWERL